MGIRDRFDPEVLKSMERAELKFPNASRLAKKDLDLALEEVWKQTLDFYNKLALKSDFFENGGHLYKYILMVKHAIFESPSHSLTGSEVKQLTKLRKTEMKILRRAYKAESPEWVREENRDGKIFRLWIDPTYIERERTNRNG